MGYFFDSSALLSFYFGEPGDARVREILSDHRTDVRLSVLSMAEFWGRLHAEGWAQVFEEQWERLAGLVDGIEPVSESVTRLSIDLRAAATSRLPLTDALIAATASIHNAVLVHRDPHFLAIPSDLLKQEMLPEK